MEQNKDQSGAAVRGEAVAEAATDQIYGAVMNIPCTKTLSHFVVQSEFQAYKIGHRDARHAAADLIAASSSSARAADAPSEPSEPEKLNTDQSREYLVKFMEQYFTDKTYHRYIRGERGSVNLAGDFAWQMARALRMIESAAIKSRAADALDSQPTNQKAAFMAYFCAKFNRPDTLEFDDLSGNELEYYDFWQSAQASSQPTDGGVRNG